MVKTRFICRIVSMSSKVPADAFKVLMDSAKSGHHLADKSPSRKRKNSGDAAAHHDAKTSHGGKAAACGAPGKSFWKAGLLHAMKDPQNVVESTDTFTIIKDKYPKAKFHYLILPKEAVVDSPKELKSVHLSLLKEMEEKAQEMIHRLHPDTEFKIGFHAKPSMAHLHLHVISRDFVSECLKTKKHWNSFNTPHFLNIQAVVSKLEEKGEMATDYPKDSEIESWLKTPLKCNQCHYETKTMPNLKSHLKSHLK